MVFFKMYQFLFSFTGNDFPTGFDTQIRKIFRLLFHVLAHIYHCHFKEIVLLQLHAHLNAVFVHFVEFSLKFQIVEEKELEVSPKFPFIWNNLAYQPKSSAFLSRRNVSNVFFHCFPFPDNFLLNVKFHFVFANPHSVQRSVSIVFLGLVFSIGQNVTF